MLGILFERVCTLLYVDPLPNDLWLSQFCGENFSMMGTN